MNGKKLGFGLMRLPLTDPNNGGSVDIPQLQQMVDTFIERGFTYFDTAYFYCEGQSERAVKEVLTRRHPRNSFTITSKLPSYPLKELADRDRVFNEQLEKTGVDYFDYYLLHAIGSNNIDVFRSMDCFRWIQEKKEAGLAKKIGFSYHDGPELLDQVLTEYPQFDFVQLQINYLDWESKKVQSRACYEVACKHHKPVIVMEPVKGGVLANVPEAVERMMKNREPKRSVSSWAVRFAASLDNVMMVLSGMSNMQQLLDNTDYMADMMPLTPDEVEMTHLAAEIINGNIVIPCTGCAYCTSKCPQNIAIPKYFSLINDQKQGRADTQQCYEELAVEFGRASDCIGCGQCEDICPQTLPVRKLLEDVRTAFE